MIHIFVLFVVVIGFIGLLCDYQRITYDIIMFEGEPLEIQLRNNHIDLHALEGSKRDAIEKAWRMHHRILSEERCKAKQRMQHKEKMDALKMVQEAM
jgi:hypothetical protein